MDGNSPATDSEKSTQTARERSVDSRRGFLVAVSAAVGGLAGCPSRGSEQGSTRKTADSSGSGEQQSSQSTVGSRRSGSQSEPTFTDLYRQVIDSVTLIQTSTGSGSGWVIDDHGRIVTNQHVVGTDERVDVRYDTDEWESAEVLGTDPIGDLAVVEPSNPPSFATPLPYTTSSSPVGSDVAIVGAPFGLPGSLSVGVVSSTGRLLESPTDSSIPGSIQVDATANPGNSGGPIFRSDGTVIGVLVAGSGIAVNFGISGRLVDRVVPSLIETGEYRYPSLGVLLQEVDPRIARANNLDSVTGVIVRRVAPNSPAATELQESTRSAIVEDRTIPVGGDVIVRLDDQVITSHADYASYLAFSKRPGEDVDVTVLRDGEQRTVTMPLGARATPK